MFDPTSIPEYPTFCDDLSGRPLRHHMHRDFHHVGAKEWRDWSIWQEILARAYGQGLQTDAAVGQILDALHECAAAENTLVVWVCDHGDALASHGGLWDKASTYTEEVARVPLAVRWPARMPGRRATDRLVSNMDVTATMLDAAGIPAPATMDSRSLLPLCRYNPAAEWPDELICEHSGHGEDILQRILFHDRYKYVAALYDGDELYDLAADPFELHNLIDLPEYHEVRSELRRRILAHIKHTADRRASRLAYALRLGF
jgi:arylsulfatase A-like enzyme